MAKVKFVQKKDGLWIVIDTRPPKRVRRAQRRIERRLREIKKHFEGRVKGESR